MSQTTFSTAPAIGLAGQIADFSKVSALSRLNGEASTDLPFGVGVCQDPSNDAECLLPAASTDQFIGVTMRDHSRAAAALASTGAIAPEDMASIMKDGTVFVLPEQNVTQADPVYLRYTVDGSDATLKPGRFRKDPAGTAQVDTVTPTAVNDTQYALSIDGRAYFVTSDASATATEIADAFRTAINADADCKAAGTGTATLILTAKTAGIGFKTVVGANLALVNTTANAAKAMRITNAKWAKAGSANAATPLTLDLV